MSGMPSRSACARVASEVGTHLTFRPVLDPAPHEIDEAGRGGAGAEPQRHAVFHQRQRALGGLLLPVVGGQCVSIARLLRSIHERVA